MKIAIGLVVLVHLSGVVSAQEPPEPSPKPAVPSPAVPKFRVPSLPAGFPPTLAPAPTAPTSGDAPMPPAQGPLLTRPAKPAVRARMVRLPGAARPDPSDPGLPRLSLQAISVIDGRPVAVINGQKIVPGEMIAGARVIRILEHGVELEYQGRRFALSF